MKLNKSEVLEQYSEVARKLGKLPSRREYAKFGGSERQVRNHFKTFDNMKLEALKRFEFLTELSVPIKLELVDIENYRVKLEKNKVKKQNDKATSNASTLDYIHQFAEQVFNGRINTKHFKSNEPTKRYFNIILSDLHFGADIDGEETGGPTFGKKEESRRLAKVVNEVCTYKEEYRDSTELNVILLGDVIQGALGHDPRDGAALAEQYCRAIHLLIQALGTFSQKFKKVNVYCNPGNHDRIISRHIGRAVHSKYDSYATMLYYSLKKACSNVPNINFIIPKTPYVIVEVFDKKIYAWHGDTGIKTGNVGKAINIKSINDAINSINASLADTKEYSAFVCGHLHLGTVSFLPNNTTLIVNGGLPPFDPFCVSLGIQESSSGQMLFESVPNFAVGDIRYIRVDAETDKDESLDKLIEPWESFKK